MSTRFGPAVRLHRRAEYDLVQKQGRRVATPFVIVLGRHNGLDHDRLGIIASRRFGHSVARSRAKRRIRELFRQHEPDVTKSRGRIALDVVAIPRRGLNTAPFAVLSRDFENALIRLRCGTRSSS